MQVQLCEDVSAAELFQDRRDQGKWISVFYGLWVENLVVDTWPQASIPFSH